MSFHVMCHQPSVCKASFHVAGTTAARECASGSRPGAVASAPPPALAGRPAPAGAAPVDGRPTLQSAAPLERKALSLHPRRAKGVADMARDGELMLDPPYQRGSVWSTGQRVALVRSFLTGVPVPAITLADRADRSGDRRYRVVDGKQRVEAAAAWFSGELAVPASWFEAEDVLQTVQSEDGPYVRWDGLSARARTRMSVEALLPIIEFSSSGDVEEANMYLLLNGEGVAQTPADMDNARAVAGL